MIKVNYNKLYLFLLINIFIISPSNTYADSKSFYNAQDIKVIINYNAASDIRNSAIEIAKRNGFNQISRNLLGEEEFKRLSIEDITISNLIESIEVESEKISSDTYEGIFSIYFNPYRVREFYSSNSLIFSDVVLRNLPITIGFKDSDKFFLFSNIWKTGWKNVQSIENKIFTKIQLVEEFNAKNNVSDFLESSYLEISTSNEKNEALIWSEIRKISENELTMDIIVKFIINNKSNTFQKTFVQNIDVIDETLFSEMITEIEKEILNIWIQSTKTNSKIEIISFQYNGKNISDWIELRNSLEKIDMISNYSINQFDLEKVHGTIEFRGEIDQFAPVLREYNLISTNFGQYHELSLYD